MLRITMETSDRSASIKLEGRLMGLWVQELERAWQEVASRRLLVDMRGVSAIDQAGKDLLARMFKGGADLVADMPMTKYVIEQVTQRQNESETGD